jgi:hypothetical protein
MIPTAGFNKVSNGPSSSGVGLGDLTLQTQYRLTKFHEGSLIPTTSWIWKPPSRDLISFGYAAREDSQAHRRDGFD